MRHVQNIITTGTKLMSATKRFAKFAVEGNTTTSARAVMELSIADWFAVSIAGQNEPVSEIVRSMVLAEGGAEEASIFGGSVRLPARAAAFANGATAHALDYDDTHFAYIGHPSAAVLPAAFAIAEKTGASGAATLEAATLGVETACRIGAWLGLEHYHHGFHQTATAGTFGATVAACRLMGLNIDETEHALGVAASLASGVKAQFGTMGKPMHAGLAAQNGVKAATLAASGFISCTDALERSQGFALTHAAKMHESALDGLGEEYLFETVQHKFHACCHGLHAALEALAEARDEHNVAPQDVAEVTVTIHPQYLDVCNIWEPATGLEAKFSYRLTTALCLYGYKTASLDTYTDEICREPALVALRNRVKVATDDSMTSTAARVDVTAGNGNTTSIDAS